MSEALRTRPSRALSAPVLAVLFSLAPSLVGAQSSTVTVRVKDNFRASPNGGVMAVLEPGTPLRVLSSQDRWLEVEADGWVWIRSLQVARREGMDLVVSEAGGENLRAEPSGRVLAHLEPGTLLKEEERIPGWIRVRRQGWVWAPSTDATAATAAPRTSPAAAPTRTATPPPPRGTATAESPPRSAPPAPTPSPTPSGFHRVAPGGAAVLASPGGDTLARAGGGAELAVLAREGSWSRVRVEGWIWTPPAEAGSSGDAPLAETGPSRVAADPDTYRGRLVSWELQFVSRERAEKVRTDFYEGEPFLLARHADGVFVYVAVPPDRLVEVEGLVPLERITVVGRVRVAASDLTGSPILDLVELQRAPRR